MLAVAVEVVVPLLVVAALAEVAQEVLEVLQVHLEQQTLVEAAGGLETTLVHQVLAVQALSFFVIQTHSEPQQAQQVHQRLLWLEALGSTNLQPLVLLRSKMNALAPSATVAVGASWSRSQEWLSCARVLRDCLHSTRPNAAAQRNDGVARQKCALLQVNRIHGDLEQPSRVGGHGRLHMAS